MITSKEEVTALIVIEKLDTFWTHFLCFLNKNKKRYGNHSSKEVRLWQHTSWTASLHSVFIFTFNNDNNLVHVRSKLNIFGKVFFLGIFTILLSFFSWKLYTLYKNERFWLYASIIAVFMILFVVLCKAVYEGEKRIQQKAIFEKLAIDMTNKHIDNEHWLFRIFIRILTYPIGLGTLYASIFHFFPTQQYEYAILGMTMVSAYFITDIILLFKRKKKTDEGMV